MQAKRAAGMAAVAAAALMVLAPAASQARSVGIAAARYSFLPSTIVVAQGGTVEFANLDLAMHTVTAVDESAPAVPLFDSGMVGTGQTAQVRGAETLDKNAAGYAFFCQVHPSMQGTIVVL